MLRYLVEAQRLIDSGAVRGLGFGTDQIVLNLYCHSNKGPWRAIPDGWNYCLAGRNRSDYKLRRNGFAVATNGAPVHVVHGNAGTLGGVEWCYIFQAAASGGEPFELWTHCCLNGQSIQSSRNS